MRRTTREMKIMRTNVNNYLKKAEGDYKKAYELYNSFLNKLNEIERNKVINSSCIKGLSDFRNEAKKNSNNETVEVKKEEIIEKITKDSFRNMFINKLERYFGFRCYWNGKEAQKLGLNCNRSLGCSYSNLVGRPIVLKFRNDTLGMFSTLIHEYAHSYLHYENSLNGCEREIEAETVAKKVFNLLGLDVTKHNKYITIFENKYLKKYGEKYVLRPSRMSKIMRLVKIIFNLFYKQKKIIKNLNNIITVAKPRKIYQIICKDCGKVVATRKTLKGALNLCHDYISYCCKEKLEYKEIER